MIFKTICPLCNKEITLPEPSPTLWINIFTPKFVGDPCEECAEKLWLTAIVAATILDLIKHKEQTL